MKLYSYLRDYVPPTTRSSFINALWAVSQDAVPFDITNVTDWLLRDKTGDDLMELFLDLGPCTPPYGATFMEFPAMGDESLSRSKSQAVLLASKQRTLDRTDPDMYDKWDFYGVPIGTEIPATVDTDDPAYGRVYVPDGGWIVNCTMIMEDPYTGGVGTWTDCGVGIALDPDGTITRSPDGQFLGIKAYISLRDDEGEDIRDALRTALYESAFTALFACSLLHCKNVTEQERRLPRQQARARERKQLEPLLWKTLKVSPIRRTPTSAVHAHARAHVKRSHLCRGHFAEYGPKYGKGLLFGKHAGRFWVPPVVKGSPEAGQVDKTYNVKTGLT
jgi:hypothetical protein